jgi:SAM-dependent methyltransferase
MTQIQGDLLDTQQLDTKPLADPPTGSQQAVHEPTAGAETVTRPPAEAFAPLFDPTTLRRLELLGAGPGWRCWEVGPGGASVANWLAKKVGPTGRVVATDTDVSWASSSARQVEVRRHEVGTQPPPGDGFDLVHARLVLGGLTDRDLALRSMVASLRPGGRLLVEDADPALQPLVSPDESGPDQLLANRIRHGCRAVLAEIGVDLTYGRTLPRLLREAGLQRVEADVHFPLASAACTALELETVRRLRGRLIAARLVTEEEVDRHLANVASGTMDLATAPMISAWGRKS